MALAPSSETPLLFVQPPSPAINGFVSVGQRRLCQGFVADRSSEDCRCAWEDVGLRRGSETVHVTKTGCLRAVQMHLHLEVLVGTAANFGLHIRGPSSPSAQRLCFQFRGVRTPPTDSSSFSPDLELASVHPPTFFKDRLLSFLSFHFCLWPLPGSR